MRDVNGSSFVLLADQSDWAPAPVDRTDGPPLGVVRGMTWTASTWTLAGKQSWRLPGARLPADARATALASTSFVVIDASNGIARINAAGVGVESLDGATWTPIVDQNGAPLAPKVGKFIAMSLGGSRLALVASDGSKGFLELFDLRGRWPLDSAENPSIDFRSILGARRSRRRRTDRFLCSSRTDWRSLRAGRSISCSRLRAAFSFQPPPTRTRCAKRHC